MAEEAKIEVEKDIIKEINDGYARKKKIKSIILFSIVSSIVLALSAILIAFSAMKINTKPSTIAEPTTFYTSSNRPINSSDYDEFYELYLNSFETTYLTGLFTGSLSGYEIKEKTNEYFYNSFNTTTKVGTGMKQTLKDYVGSDYINIHYEEAQTLYKANGEVYKAKANSEKYTITFKDVYLPLSTENKYDDVTFYIGAYGVTEPPFIITITVKGNTNALYNFVSQL